MSIGPVYSTDWHAVLISAEKLGLCAGLLLCNKYGFAQIQNLTGRWADSPKADFNGFYTMLTDCPSWVREYDCKNPSLTGTSHSPLSLHMWPPEGVKTPPPDNKTVRNPTHPLTVHAS